MSTETYEYTAKRGTHPCGRAGTGDVYVYVYVYVYGDVYGDGDGDGDE